MSPTPLLSCDFRQRVERQENLSRARLKKSIGQESYPAPVFREIGAVDVVESDCMALDPPDHSAAGVSETIMPKSARRL